MKIQLTDLLINTENPRFDHQESQRSAIENMIVDQSEKIHKLSKHIIQNGVNPSELVITKKEKNGRFTVLEGNRRVIALKLLSNPEILDDNEFKKEKQKFKDLHLEFAKNPITELECIVFESEEEAEEWIKLKHTGENEGVGTVRWNAQQVARFEEKVSKKRSATLDLIRFLSESNLIDEKDKALLKNVPVSSLERLITDKNVQELVGFVIENNKVKSVLPEKEVIKGFLKIIRDLAEKTIKVKDIYSKEDRGKYLESFKKEDIPEKNEVYDKPWNVDADSGNNKVSNNPKSIPKKRSKPLTINRKNVIPRSCILKISDTRINTIYRELKNLDCENFTNSASVIFRVFVELTLDAYIEDRQLTTVSINSKLSTKIEKIVENLKDKSLINDPQAKGILNLAKTPHSFFSVNTFNAYVHNKDFNPLSKDLKITWDNIQFFIEVIWSELE